MLILCNKCGLLPWIVNKILVVYKSWEIAVSFSIRSTFLACSRADWVTVSDSSLSPDGLCIYRASWKRFCNLPAAREDTERFSYNRNNILHILLRESFVILLCSTQWGFFVGWFGLVWFASLTSGMFYGLWTTHISESFALFLIPSWLR